MSSSFHGAHARVYGKSDESTARGLLASLPAAASRTGVWAYRIIGANQPTRRDRRRPVCGSKPCATTRRRCREPFSREGGTRIHYGKKNAESTCSALPSLSLLARIVSSLCEYVCFLGHEASRRQGSGIPNRCRCKLLERLDLRGRSSPGTRIKPSSAF